MRNSVRVSRVESLRKEILSSFVDHDPDFVFLPEAPPVNDDQLLEELLDNVSLDTANEADNEFAAEFHYEE